MEHKYLAKSLFVNGKESQIKVHNPIDITQHIIDVVGNLGTGGTYDAVNGLQFLNSPANTQIGLGGNLIQDTEVNALGNTLFLKNTTLGVTNGMELRDDGVWITPDTLNAYRLPQNEATVGKVIGVGNINESIFIDNSDYFQINLNNQVNLANGQLYTFGIPNLPTNIRIVEFTLTCDVLAAGSIKFTPSYKNNLSTTGITDITINVTTANVAYSQSMNYDILQNDKGTLKFLISTYAGGIDLRNVSLTLRYIRLI